MSSWKQKKSVINRYNTTSDSYNEQYSQEQDDKYKAAQKALNNKDVYTNVLDVGCGSGLFFSTITDKAETVVGVDVTRNLLLKAKTQANRYSNVHIVLADADYLPFKPAGFDVIFSFTVLQNMPKPQKTLLEFKQQAKNDGKVVVTGLKKAFELTAFLDLFEAANLRMLEFVEDDDLKCYIAITEKLVA